MGLSHQKSCPLEDNFLKVYGIPAPDKWKPQNCPQCQYQEKDRCQYKKAQAQQEKLSKRGQPVLVKRANLTSPLSQRQKAENDALKKAGFSSEEQQQYRMISAQLDVSWEAAGLEARKELLDQLDQWKVHLEKGFKPAEAYNLVKEWLKQREEFRKSA